MTDMTAPTASPPRKRRSSWQLLLANRLAAAGLFIFGFIVILALLAPLLPIPNPDLTDQPNRLLPPLSEGHLFGTDHLGRDILSRLIWGTQVSLLVGISATALAALFGSLIGLVAGYARGATDSILMRFVDMLMAFPYILLAIAIVAALGPGLLNALYAIALVNIPFFARNIRGVTVSIRNREFVDAARLSGKSHAAILFTEVLPNVLPVIVITMSTTVGWMILETAGLSFLGLGAQPPTSDLGSMLGQARAQLFTAPHASIIPGIMIFILVMSINLLGDGIRDVLDPRLRSGALDRPMAVTKIARKANPAPSLPDAPALVVEGLSTGFDTGDNVTPAVRDIGFRLGKGECLGLIGESGSGKSVTALSLMGLVASPPGVITAGGVYIEGKDVLSLREQELIGLRGARVAYVFQDPLTTLHPLFAVGHQIAEAILAHKPIGKAAARTRAVELMETVGIRDAASRASAYPHELSGGQRQRIGIAMALANDPDIIIADEPTTALDVTVQARILELLQTLRRERGLALLLITHDFGVVAQVCDRVAVMRHGEIVEQGETALVLRDPQHDYTKRLIACVPELGEGHGFLERVRPLFSEARPMSNAVQIRDLTKTFGGGRSLFGRKASQVHAVRGISLDLARGETLGIVGESGSGKSTLARMLVGLEQPSSGTMLIDGKPWADLAAAGSRSFGRTIQYVFQDPVASLNPRKTIGQILDVPLRLICGYDAGKRTLRKRQLIDAVQMPLDTLERYPHEFSGGQAQRIAIARALAAEASILVLDEPVSALDVSVQAQVLLLLQQLRDDLGLSYLFISHDLAVVESISDRVAVMYLGEVVEVGPAAQLFATPQHDYTRSLIASAPRLTASDSAA